MSLLITKTRIPLSTPNLVARPRLLSSLDALLQPGCQVAIISAPAGFGKTTLLTQWLHTIPESFRVGWLSLDQSDNDLIRFFTYIVGALKKADPEIGENFSELIEAHPELTIDEIITYIINQVDSSSQNILLVIDDIHVVTDTKIHHAIEMLVHHLPSNLRIVFAGRVDPSLPLPRLRARGQLIEIRTADLRFKIEETSRFMDRFTGLPSLVASLAEVLTHSTEGWAAGLQMMAIALRAEMQVHSGPPAELIEQFMIELNNSHRYILDYLLDEVLNREEMHVREFLLRTCILERFNADLCTVLCTEETSVAAAQSMIETLERANLFIVPLDNQREWYRYHHLFADVLKKQLLHVHPGLEPELHRRAASWLEQNGMIDEAIEHARQTKDAAFMQMLVEKHALGNILRGQITSAARWLNSLSLEVLNSSPRLCLDRAWVLTFTSQTEAAGEFLEHAENLLRDHSEESDPIKCEILGLRSFHKGIYGETTDALRLAELARSLSSETNLFLQCSSRMFLAIALIRNGKFDEAMGEYHFIQSIYQDDQGLAGLALLEADFLQFAAVSLNLRNETKQAIQLLKDAIQNFEQSSNGYRKMASLYLYVGLGKILYASNQLEEAESVLNRGLRIDSLSLSFAAIDGWTTLWWVKIGQRNYYAARSIINNLESSTSHCDEKIRRLVVLPGALQDLLEGKIDSAVKRVKKLGFTDDVDVTLANISDAELMGWRVNEFFVYARTLVAQGKPQLGLRVLDRMAHAAQEKGMDLVLCRMWLNQAIVYSNEHQNNVAMEIMAKLLKKTSRFVFGAAHIYLSTGEPARILLLQAQKQGLYPEHVFYLLSAFPIQVDPEPIPDSPEALSEREIEVLRLMAEGMKNQEIADRLVVSLNTIRYHTKNIFGKLGVDNRTAAVVRARELSLFE